MGSTISTKNKKIIERPDHLRVGGVESIVEPGFSLRLPVLFQAVERGDTAGRGTVAGHR